MPHVLKKTHNRHSGATIITQISSIAWIYQRTWYRSIHVTFEVPQWTIHLSREVMVIYSLRLEEKRLSQQWTRTSGGSSIYAVRNLYLKLRTVVHAIYFMGPFDGSVGRKGFNTLLIWNARKLSWIHSGQLLGLYQISTWHVRYGFYWILESQLEIATCLQFLQCPMMMMVPSRMLYYLLWFLFLPLALL